MKAGFEQEFKSSEVGKDKACPSISLRIKVCGTLTM